MAMSDMPYFSKRSLNQKNIEYYKIANKINNKSEWVPTDITSTYDDL